ncbi:nicotinamide-nucleotide amidohydrolase family protein [Photobacterium sp. SDRW27]|uniref:CinA family protein n=1 Tax=Photobacterium obscurum TaxID=2829490 RepID=UPI002242F5D4|nr:nicotinamide-nucleotide amidohydrolase family protein [Photobacterium obscurum]MCW8330611.1 nicotinamide-nucleotide amidohydrolase family protein [Photobacterium obscurum]
MAIIQQLAQELGDALNRHGWVATTAESCTGGGVSSAITDIAGSSGWFDRAFVTYSNEAKQQMLGVAAATLDSHGAVSEQVVREMASGALSHSAATISVAISGIAGPGGGTEVKPVGTVCFAWADKTGWMEIETCLFDGDRNAVRQQAVEKSLSGMLQRMQQLG